MICFIQVHLRQAGLPVILILNNRSHASIAYFVCKLIYTTNVNTITPKKQQIFCIAWRLCSEICQWPGTGWWFSPGTPVSSTNTTDHHYIIVYNWNIVESGVAPRLEKFEDTKGLIRYCQPKKDNIRENKRPKDTQWSTKHYHIQ